jgi:CII-binding regulator of phage lambda lysogenization HflD
MLSSKELIVLGAGVRLDLEASEAAIEQLLADLEEDSAKAIVFDLRTADCTLSVAEIYSLVDFLSRYGSKRVLYGKIAVLLDAQASQRKATFFALCAKNRGFEARAFNTVEEINDWLGLDASGLLSTA